MEYRQLRENEANAAARLHLLAAVLIPGFDPDKQSGEQIAALYHEAFGRGPIWGAFDNDVLVGILALEPGWIEHLYVDRSRNGEGIGRALVRIAQAEQDDLQLYTWQANQRARHLYEAAGFLAEEFGVDPSDERGAPNVRYRWRRA